MRANLLAADAPQASGRVYNVACGRATTLLELVERLNALLGTRIAPVHEVPRPGDVRHSQADISRARAELGFEPAVGLQEGLRRCVAHATAGRRAAEGQV